MRTLTCLLLLTLAQVSRADWYTVGGGPGADFQDLQVAIDTVPVAGRHQRRVRETGQSAGRVRWSLR